MRPGLDRFPGDGGALLTSLPLRMGRTSTRGMRFGQNPAAADSDDSPRRRFDSPDGRRRFDSPDSRRSRFDSPDARPPARAADDGAAAAAAAAVEGRIAGLEKRLASFDEKIAEQAREGERERETRIRREDSCVPPSLVFFHCQLPPSVSIASLIFHCLHLLFHSRPQVLPLLVLFYCPLPSLFILSFPLSLSPRFSWAPLLLTCSKCRRPSTC
jgi:hypothetical protein